MNLFTAKKKVEWLCKIKTFFSSEKKNCFVRIKTLCLLMSTSIKFSLLYKWDYSCRIMLWNKIFCCILFNLVKYQLLTLSSHLLFVPSPFLSVCDASHKINRRCFLLVASAYSWRTAIILSSTSHTAELNLSLAHTSLSIYWISKYSARSFVLNGGIIIFWKKYVNEIVHSITHLQGIFQFFIKFVCFSSLFSESRKNNL